MNGGTISNSNANSADLLPTVPTVEIAGRVIPYCIAQQVQLNDGVMPAKALIKIAASGYDVEGPITLGRYDFGIVKGQRALIKEGSLLAFAGMVKCRRDSGESNSVIFELADDRIYLQMAHIRGAVVWDEGDNKPKFLTRYPMMVNASNQNNCIIKGGVPYFTAYWERGADAGGMLEQQTDTTDTEGVPCRWTTDRLLRHWAYLLNLKAGAIEGTGEMWWSLAASDRLKFPAENARLSAMPAECYAALPECDFTGQTWALALQKTLRMAGVVEMRAAYKNGTTVLGFYSTKKRGDGEATLQIPVVRAGNVTDYPAHTALDYDLEEDCEEQRGAFVTDGGIVHVETELVLDSNDDGTPVSGNTARKGWHASEESIFETCRKGVYNATDHLTYAKRPTSIPANGDWSAIGTEICDGNGGRPNILALTPACIAMLRQFFPNTWRVVRIDTDGLISAGVNQGVGAVFASAPFLNMPRPVLTEQLQRYIVNYLNDKTLRTRAGIQITIDDAPVPKLDGLQISPMGDLCFDGLTEEAGGFSLLYRNSFFGPTVLKLKKKIRINVAIPLDLRTFGYATGKPESLDDSHIKQLGAPLMGYVRNDDAFKTEHQKNSRPIAGVSSVPSVGYSGMHDACPLNRVLADGSPKAQEYSTRKLDSLLRPRVTSTWHMLGIRPEYEIGAWIESAYFLGETGGYPINAPIKTLLRDYDRQRTVIGGLLHTVSAKSSPEAKKMYAEPPQQPEPAGKQEPRLPPLPKIPLSPRLRAAGFSDDEPKKYTTPEDE